jgi:hypothetical protein
MTLHNRYLGINPHLNSLLQTPGTPEQPALWATFHNRHITHICDFLNQQLPAHYMAFSEQSLQTRGIEPGGDILIRNPEPDVSIFRQHTGQSVVAVAQPIPVWQGKLIHIVEPVRRLTAVLVREVEKPGILGQLVARIELLSPANKRGGSDYRAYLIRRSEAIQSGIPLIEIDYLHEIPSLLPDLPVYPSDEGAYPYSIAVYDPRPIWEDGISRVYGFRVDEKIAPFLLPLAETDQLIFDLTPVYQHTFESGRWGNLVDYSLMPARFETYSMIDRASIQQKMASIALETGS